MAGTFQATIGGKFSPLISLRDDAVDIDTTYNTAVTDTASEIIGKERPRNITWVTRDVLDLCHEWMDLKEKQYEAEGANGYRKPNKRAPHVLDNVKEAWIGIQCAEIKNLPKAGDGSNFRKVHNCARQVSDISNRRTRDYQQMDRVLLR